MPETDSVAPAPASDPRSRGLSRRRFLGLAGGTAAVGVIGATLGPRAWEELFAGSTPETADTAPAGPLVLVTLYGGNDGLNTVIPYQDPAYESARGPLALDASTVLPLSEGFGLHPSMPGFKKLWDQKKLAVIQGVGFADPNYSHFESMDIWQSAVPSGSVSTGWIGRWLDATAGGPLRAVGVGPTTPMALTGEKVQGVTIPAGKLVLPGKLAERGLYAEMAGSTAGEAFLLAQAAQSNGYLLQVDKTLGPILDRSASANPLHLNGSPGSSAATASAQQSLAIANGGGGVAGSEVLATQLSMVANLILGGAASQVYSVELGGFDTHTDQTPTQQLLLGELDQAVSAFVDTVSSDPRGKGAVVLVYTEFGRRVGGNASAGSDHGWANVAFAAGPSVHGGWYGEPPSLTKLSEDNTIYTTDFRSVYATVLDRVIGVDPQSFLDGPFPTMNFV
ncbi:MAG: DUF1501 domain-containing protein [Acidimicrobiales bacterium]